MTREHKLALIVGFSLILLVGVLISDHLSKAGQAQLSGPSAGSPVRSGAVLDEAPAAVLALPNPPEWSLPPDVTEALESAAAVQVAAGTSAAGGGVGLVGGMPAAPVPFPESPAPIGDGTLAAVPDASGPAIIKIGSLAGQQIVDGAMGAMDALRDTAQAIGQATTLADTSGRTTWQTRSPSSAPQPSGLERLAGPLVAAEREYVVKKGDSLSKIAEETLGSRDRWQEIMAVNKDRVTEPALIREGMKLRLPAGARVNLASAREEIRERAGRELPAKAPAAGRSRQAASARTYVVRKGDTLGEIAQRTLGSVRYAQSIMKANGIDDPNRILVGMELKIPEQG